MDTPMRKSDSRIFVLFFWAAIMFAAACGTPFGPFAVDTPAQIEQKIFQLVNNHRRSIGVNELAWNETIAGQARLHSQSMAAGTVPLGHDGFEGRVALIAETIPWQSAAEIVALAATAADAVDGWIASLDHKPMLEGNFDWTGIGVARGKSESSFYATEILIKQR